jgi:hypothetical protein
MKNSQGGQSRDEKGLYALEVVWTIADIGLIAKSSAANAYLI